jgi:hypothetical protein
MYALTYSQKKFSLYSFNLQTYSNMGKVEEFEKVI